MDSSSLKLQSSSIDCVLFDLDDTLYPFTTGIQQAVKANIEDFLVEVCGFSRDEAAFLRVDLFKKYGSTLAGLRALGYDVSADDYHSFIHGRLPYERIAPNPQLKAMLQTIKQRKIVFTNSDRNHAVTALKRLGLDETCFEQIICFETLNPNLPYATRPDEFPIVLKPSIEAMEIAVRVANVNPHRTLFLDDSASNVAAGKAVGFKTALVGKATKTVEADYAVESIDNLPMVVPEIWLPWKAIKGSTTTATAGVADSTQTKIKRNGSASKLIWRRQTKLQV